MPASGLVTALEPVLLACDGTWIAHGSGRRRSRHGGFARSLARAARSSELTRCAASGSREEEEKGYYEGFANEGLWPLCHIAHTRPIFRSAGLDALSAGEPPLCRRGTRRNGRDSESPIVLVQDYHFALLPRMVKEARPDARVAIFWHIPWPNPEVFGICPWQRELVDGLLGADLSASTHSRTAIIFWKRWTAPSKHSPSGTVSPSIAKATSRWCGPIPISVAFREPTPAVNESRNSGEERAALCAELGIEASLLGVGVDRVDYTKGILERFRGIERFLQEHPAYQRRFTFVQIGAPSRTDIERYRQFLDEVAVEADRINARFQAGRWKPIVLLKKHHSHEEIARYYRAASVCLVTSLHDGMNLVAKEFVASRDDDRGVLILSTFAGASLELTDALQVNPYDVQQVAEAILKALNMPEDQEAERMLRMRVQVREYNVYRWAARLLSDLTEIRIDTPERAETPVPALPGEVAGLGAHA